MVTTITVAKMMELMLSVALRQNLENKVSQWTSLKSAPGFDSSRE
jgi:hypothetical protein